MQIKPLFLALGAGASLAALAILACGPDFPNLLLTAGDAAVLTAPSANFARELQRMPLPKSPYPYVPPPEEGHESGPAELADLRLALQTRGDPPERIAAILAQHALQRMKLQAGTDPIQIVDGLPPEFADYFRASIAWHQPAAGGEPARTLWQALLHRPATERQYKSTWAAFMLGVAQGPADGGPDQALGHFRRVRSLVDEGFADSLGLAAASFGLEARIHLQRRDFARAFERYLDQMATGDPTALESLRIVAAQALQLENAEQLQLLAANPSARRIITAFLVSGRSPAFDPADAEGVVARWLGLLETENARDLDLAERLALAAYQEGEMELAQRWLDRAAADSFAVRWLNAKLLLYHGRIAEAADLLSRLAGDFPVQRSDHPGNSSAFGEELHLPGSSTQARAQVQGEAGVIRLARREFTEALDALLQSGYWLDASYVAERVLTLPELKSYVDTRWPAEVPPNPDPQPRESETTVAPATTREDIRYLLARRLARAGQEETARPYFPEEWVKLLDEFLDLRGAGFNPQKPARDRARYLFGAAKIMRERGLELWGTETGPDWHVYGGDFSEGVTPETRGTISHQHQLVPTKEELTRAYAHAPQPDTRFHYRYVAADLALEAAKLLPNNELQTAIILCTAGSWIKNLDPKAADVFYKTLVRRCRKTRIGQEADQIRWFPRIDDQGNILPRIVPQPALPPPPEVEPAFPILALLQKP